MSNTNHSPTTNTSSTDVAPPRATTTGDIIWLVVLLVISGTLIWVGAGMLVVFFLSFVVILSMMTAFAVLEERGEQDPTVKRARKSMPLVALVGLPVPLIWLLGLNPLFTLPSFAALLAIACWKWFTSQPRMTLRVLLRGAAEKQPAYFDQQIARNVVFLLVIFLIYSFDPSHVTTTLRDRPTTRHSPASDELAGIAADLERTQQLLENLSTVSDQLLETVTTLTVDHFAEMTTEQKNAFLDDLATDGHGPSQSKHFLLTRLLEREQDPAIKQRITTLLNAQ